METTTHNAAKICIVLVWILSCITNIFFFRNSPTTTFIAIWIVTIIFLISFICCQYDN